MKRDIGLIRELLLRLEVYPKGANEVHHLYYDDPALAVDGHNRDDIEYHMSLIQEAGFLEDFGFGTAPADGFIFRRLSWTGHDFLDAARNNTVWAEAKKIIAEKGGSIPFDLVKVLLTELAKRALFGS